MYLEPFMSPKFLFFWFYVIYLLFICFEVICICFWIMQTMITLTDSNGLYFHEKTPPDFVRSESFVNKLH